MNADPRLQPDELSMRQPDATPNGDELAEDPKDPFVYFFEQLAAEWQPVGFTEWQVILDLTALYSKLREIRLPQVTEGSEVAPGPKNDGEAQEGEDQVNAQDQERQDALFAMAMRLGWEGSPEQQVRWQRAALEDLIEKKIRQLIFLQTAKAKLRDLSNQHTVVARSDRARLPRGDYRVPVKDRTNPKSEAPAPSDHTTVSG